MNRTVAQYIRMLRRLSAEYPELREMANYFERSETALAEARNTIRIKADTNARIFKMNEGLIAERYVLLDTLERMSKARRADTVEGLCNA